MLFGWDWVITGVTRTLLSAMSSYPFTRVQYPFLSLVIGQFYTTMPNHAAQNHTAHHGAIDQFFARNFILGGSKTIRLQRPKQYAS